MGDTQQDFKPGSKPKRDTLLRDERLQQLMDSCQQEVLRQIIGPFGLTPAMFDDKDGGNVTTQHNAEQGIFSKESEEFDREKDYDYSSAKTKKKSESVKNGGMNSMEFVDAYTGKSEPTMRVGKNGKLVMNAELDHLVPLKEIHRRGGWMKGKGGRNKLSSIPENLHFTTFETNRGENGKHAKLPEEHLTSSNGFDENRIKPMVDRARESIEREMPSVQDRVKYHGVEIAKEGAKDLRRNALRQALGLLLHEFVNGSFVEIKIIIKNFKQKDSEQSLIDRLTTGLRRVMNRVIGKFKTMLEAVVQGGVQGFISSLLTFLINNLITTSKKIVTIIRESMQSLWKAIKLMLNPPQDMSAFEITREVTKIIAAVVTTGLGMLLEESVKGFIMSIPVLAPIADVLSVALTAIMTGITGALIVYGIDRLFDWLSSTGTELLAAQEESIAAQATVIGHLQTWLDHQFENSRLYESCAAEYQKLQEKFSIACTDLNSASLEASGSMKTRDLMIDAVETQIGRKRRLEEALKLLEKPN